MATTDSRLGPGTLTLGSTSFSGQLTNVRLSPTTDEIDGTPVLDNPTPDPEVQDAKWVLAGSAIQDWEDSTGFVEYCRDNHGTSVAFTWVPNSAADVTYSGNCIIKALEIGGDVATQITTDFEFRVTGQPTVSYV